MCSLQIPTLHHICQREQQFDSTHSLPKAQSVLVFDTRSSILNYSQGGKAGCVYGSDVSWVVWWLSPTLVVPSEFQSDEVKKLQQEQFRLENSLIRSRPTAKMIPPLRGRGGRGRGGGRAMRGPGGRGPGGRVPGGRGHGGRVPGGRGPRSGPVGMKGGNKVIVTPHRHEGVFIGKGKDEVILTKNLVPGESVYSEKRISVQNEDGSKVEYRVWNPFRSKLAAAIIGGLDNFWIKPGAKVLYIGAASGTSVSHVSDIVGPARIVALNASFFLKAGGHYMVSIKANCIDATMPAETVFANEVKKLQADELKPAEQITLEPYERDHACVVGGYRIPKKQKAATAA
ncbi:hypothetical protein Bca4012_024920 [Brassica carinata]